MANSWISNLEMKHVGKLAIIGALLKAVKTSCVRIMQGRTYLIQHRLFSWPLLHTYYKIARVVELQLNMGWLKLRVLGSHCGHPAQKITVLPTALFTTTQKFLLVCLVGKFACIQEYFSFCTNRPFSLHATQGWTTLLIQCGTTCLYIHDILHIKYIKIISLFGEHFLGCWICRPINVFANKLTGGFFPLAIFTIRKQKKCKLNSLDVGWMWSTRDKKQTAKPWTKNKVWLNVGSCRRLNQPNLKSKTILS